MVSKKKSEKVENKLSSNHKSNYVTNLFSNYVMSFKRFGNYRWKILGLIMLDLLYILLLFSIIMAGKTIVMKQYILEVMPLAEQTKGVKELVVDQDITRLSETLKSFYTQEFTEKTSAMNKTLITLGLKILAIIVLVLAVTGLIKTTIWSIIRKSFKDFKRFLLFNCVFVFLCWIILIIAILLSKDEIVNAVVMFLIVMYIYFSIYLKSKFQESTIFKQMFSLSLSSIKEFINFVIPVLLVLLTLLVLTTIANYVGIILPSFISAIMFITITALTISWSRIYMYNIINYD